MSNGLRDATMLLTACLLYAAFTSGVANACGSAESKWVTAPAVKVVCIGATY